MSPSTVTLRNYNSFTGSMEMFSKKRLADLAIIFQNFQ